MPEINPRQITFARSRRCYTKKRLAEELGVTSRTIQNYAGTPTPDDAMLSRIALLLNFPRSFFFLEEDMPVISEHAASFRAPSLGLLHLSVLPTSWHPSPHRPARAH